MKLKLPTRPSIAAGAVLLGAAGSLVGIQSTSAAIASEEIAYQGSRAVLRRGFTIEEELFRTKWGWVSYYQVQRILYGESSE